MQTKYQTIRDSFKNGEIVTVKINKYHHPVHNKEIITGRVHKGYDYVSSTPWFYVQPLNDSHPGASITLGDILEITFDGTQD